MMRLMQIRFLAPRPASLSLSPHFLRHLLALHMCEGATCCCSSLQRCRRIPHKLPGSSQHTSSSSASCALPTASSSASSSAAFAAAVAASAAAAAAAAAAAFAAAAFLAAGDDETPSAPTFAAPPLTAFDVAADAGEDVTFLAPVLAGLDLDELDGDALLAPPAPTSCSDVFCSDVLLAPPAPAARAALVRTGDAAPVLAEANTDAAAPPERAAGLMPLVSPLVPASAFTGVAVLGLFAAFAEDAAVRPAAMAAVENIGMSAW